MNNGGVRYNDLEDRLIEFAIACVEISEGIKNSYAGRHFKDQLIRSGSSPALNYAEGRFAESRRDFIHKARIVLKELHETRVCLRIIAKTKIYAGNHDLESIKKECSELIAIFVTSIKTANKNLSTNKP